MEKNKKIALLADVDNIKIDFDGFVKVVEQVEQYGEIIYGKLYGFSDRKHRAFVNLVAQKGLDTASVMRLKKRNKSQLDVRIIIDAVDIALTNTEIDCFAIITGTGDVVPLISYLKSKGKFVIGGFEEGGEDNADVCHATINIPAPAGTVATVKKSLVATASAVKAAVKPAPKKVEEPKQEEQFAAAVKEAVKEAVEEMKEEAPVEAAPVKEEAPVEAAPEKKLTAEEKADIEEEEIFSDVFAKDMVDADKTIPTEQTVGLFGNNIKEEAPVEEAKDESLEDENDRLLKEMQNMVTDEEEEKKDSNEGFFMNDENSSDDDETFNISDYMLNPEEEEEAPAQEIDLGDEGNLATSLDDIKTMMYDFVGESKK